MDNIGLTKGFWVGAACALLWLPFEWLVAWGIAATVHECMHLLCAWICDVEIAAIKIGATGAVIETKPCKDLHQLVCIAAGPLGSLLLLALYPVFPKLAVCGLLHCVYNLLPVFDLDGRNMLNCILTAIFQEHRAGRILHWVEAVVVGMILGLGGYAILFWKDKILWGIVVGIICLKYKKSLAKR